MSEEKNTDDSEDILPEYDFDKLPGVRQGSMHARVQRMKNTRILVPDLAQEFKDDAAVNEALRDYLRMKRESA